MTPLEQEAARVCKETVGEFPHFNDCGRKVKEVIDGKAVCGIHAGALKRRAKADAKRREASRRDQEYRDRVSELAERTGINVRFAFSRGRYQHEQIVVPLDWFEQATTENPRQEPSR